jgi:hypothetical protein
MPLLRPRDARPRLTVRRHTVLRCPLNGHQVGACRGLCAPSADGLGLCGRPAPHLLVGRTQLAIAQQRGVANAAERSSIEPGTTPSPRLGKPPRPWKPRRPRTGPPRQRLA